MKIFLTGGSGFIGSAVVRRLAQKGHELLILSRSQEVKSSASQFPDNVTVLVSNLTDLDIIRNSLQRFRPDSVIHLAWEGLPDYSPPLCRKNVEMGINLFRLLADIEIERVLSVGSCWEYEPQRGPLAEDSLMNNKTPFAEAKNKLYGEGLNIFQNKGTLFLWLRLFFVYGLGQRETSLIPYTLQCIVSGKEPIINNPGARQDFVYVDDVAECIEMALASELPHSVYNVGSGTLTSCREVVALAQSVAGAEQPGDGAITDESLNYLADTSRTTREVGWRARHSLHEGIAHVMESVASFKRKKY